MIGATHLAGTRFWEPGGTASEGIERMVEEGSVSPLDAEIAAAHTAGLPTADCWTPTRSSMPAA